MNGKCIFSFVAFLAVSFLATPVDAAEIAAVSLTPQSAITYSPEIPQNVYTSGEMRQYDKGRILYFIKNDKTSAGSLTLDIIHVETQKRIFTTTIQPGDVESAAIRIFEDTERKEMAVENFVAFLAKDIPPYEKKLPYQVRMLPTTKPGTFYAVLSSDGHASGSAAIKLLTEHEWENKKRSK